MLPLIANSLPETLINKYYFRRSLFFFRPVFVLVYACASGIDSPSAGLLRGESATLSECTLDAWPRASAA